MTSKRYTQIDWMYFIGTVLVVLGHSHYSDWTVFHGTWFEQLLIFIYKFHMPIFFFVAGFLFVNSCSLEDKGTLKWIKEKALKLMIPYLFLSFAALFPKFYFEHRSFSGIGSEIINTLLIPRLGVWGHLWFLPVLLLCYIIFAVWKTTVFKNNGTVVLIVTFTVSAALYFIPVETQIMGLEDLKKSLMFFCSGMLICKIFVSTEKIKKPIRIVLAVLFFVAAILFNKFFDNSAIVNLIIGIFMIIFFWQISCVTSENKIVLWVSKHNFTIYLYSWPVQSATMFICERAGLPWYIASVIMFITGISVPVVISLIYDKFKKIQNRFFNLILGAK